MDAMEKWGGSFVKALGAAARRADGQNLERIKRAFPEYWAEYEKKGIELEEKGKDPGLKDDGKRSKCCNARMVNGGIQCEACGSNGL